MGSSAALATSLVGALLQWFGVIRLGHRAGGEDRRVLHNLAQLAHAVAQGKIGSGFDVAAAVYGTQVYQRFAPEVRIPTFIRSISFFYRIARDASSSLRYLHLILSFLFLFFFI